MAVTGRCCLPLSGAPSSYTTSPTAPGVHGRGQGDSGGGELLLPPQTDRYWVSIVWGGSKGLSA